MRILVLGDSLAMPRPREGQSLSDVWPLRLKESLTGAEVLLRARNIASSFDVLQEFNWFSESLDHLDAIVIQVGVVDAPARPFPFLLQRVLFTFGSRTLQRWVNRNFYRYLTFYRWKPWTSPKAFRSRLEEMIHRSIRANPGIRIILVKIAPGAGRMMEIIKDVRQSIEHYNGILEEIAAAPQFRDHVRLADPYSAAEVPVEEILLGDGHHLTRKGHELVRDAVTEALRA